MLFVFCRCIINLHNLWQSQDVDQFPEKAVKTLNSIRYLYHYLITDNHIDDVYVLIISPDLFFEGMLLLFFWNYPKNLKSMDSWLPS